MDEISVNIEDDCFCWKIQKLGDLGACFHCKLNGHTKKDCPLLKNVYKEFNNNSNKEDSNEKGYSDVNKNNSFDKNLAHGNSNDNEFVVQNNPLFDDEYVVVHANKNV